MIIFAASLIFLLAGPARADTDVSGNAAITPAAGSFITGQVGVGTQVPFAQLHVQVSSMDAYAIRVSSANGAALFAISPNGNVGLGVYNPQAHLDMNGTCDNNDLALQLRVGNSSNTLLSQQIVFASTAGTYGHAIVTQSTAGQVAGNSIDFFLWNSTGQPNAAASLEALSLSSSSVHIDPYGMPNAQLEVSNGLCTGCGAIVRGYVTTSSSRGRKTDIAYLDPARQARALEDVESLRHATFQYKRTITIPGKPRRTVMVSVKGKKKKKIIEPPIAPRHIDQATGPVRRGLIYEDSPASIRGVGKAIDLNKRVMNLELALQAADKEIAQVEAKIAELEKAKKGGRK